MKFIERVDDLLKDKGISANRMSKALGLGNAAYSNWKAREVLPNGETLKKLAEYFGVSMDYLTGRTDIPTPVNELAAAQIHDGGRYSDLTPEQIEKIKSYEAFLRAEAENEK